MGHVNEADLDWDDYERGTGRFHRERLARAAGGETVSAGRYELPPGTRTWPYRYHVANEEAPYVLAGNGSLRLPEGTRPLAPGDFVTVPADERGALRVLNDGDEPLRFLMVSTMAKPDVTVYPDSGKFGVYVGEAPGGEGDRPVEGFWRLDDDVDYWAGEDAEGD